MRFEIVIFVLLVIWFSLIALTSVANSMCASYIDGSVDSSLRYINCIHDVNDTNNTTVSVL